MMRLVIDVVPRERGGAGGWAVLSALAIAVWTHYISALIAVATSAPPTSVIAPSFDTRNLPLKFHPGSAAPVDSFMSCHAGRASGPLISPFLNRTPRGGRGKLNLPYANSLIAASSPSS